MLTIKFRTANGMTEALTLAVYFLLCREIDQIPQFPGNEYIWNGVDDKSYAPSIADLAVFVSTHDHCANEAFNHANGDVFIWKNFWPKLAGYFGLEVRQPFTPKANAGDKESSNSLWTDCRTHFREGQREIERINHRNRSD